jgi:hypothetical protein
MENISINKEQIKLNPKLKYVVIDALYINEIRENYNELDSENFFNEIKLKIFPYAKFPYMLYKPTEAIFGIEKIKKAITSSLLNNDSEELNYFCTDTGFILFINYDIFKEFILKFDYDKIFTDNPEEVEIDIDYWRNITNNYNKDEIAILIAIYDFGIEFDGSGFYTIKSSIEN